MSTLWRWISENAAAITVVFAFVAILPKKKIYSFVMYHLNKPKKGLDLSIAEFKVGYDQSGMYITIELSLHYSPFIRKSITIKNIEVNVMYRNNTLYFMKWIPGYRSDVEREITRGFELMKSRIKPIRMGYSDSEINERFKMYADEQNIYGFSQQGNWEIGTYDISLIISNTTGIMRHFVYEVKVTNEKFIKLQEIKKRIYDNKRNKNLSLSGAVVLEFTKK